MRTLSKKKVEQVVEYFNDYISNMSWEEWCGTCSSDWEGMCCGAIFELNLTNHTDEVYDIFDEWYEGIDESHFDNEDWLYEEFGYDEYDKKIEERRGN
jgi:hypothetical protein